MKKIILIFFLVLMIPNQAFAETEEKIMTSTQEKFNISGFLKEAEEYTLLLTGAAICCIVYIILFIHEQSEQRPL